MTETNLFPFGTLLKAFRKRRHLSQQQLASTIGVHRSAIIRWEQGDFLPESKAMILELARYLRLDDQETRQLLEASLTALAPYWHVPFQRNPFFTGREDVLEALHSYLSTDHMVASTQSCALQGLGGIGKTQIVLEYAYRHSLEYSAVLWIEAETDETVISSLLHIAEVLQIPELQESDQQRVVAAVQRWLSGHSGWLLIWDNLEDLELVSRFLPAVRQGAILFTTRCQALGTLAQGMDLAPMEQREGMVFVLRRTKVLELEATDEHMQRLAVHLPSEYAAAKQLVTIMGGLPLALDQAGAYIEETGCGIAGYLLRYEQQRRHLLNRRGMLHGDHSLSVVATLSLAYQHVAQQDPAALELLRFCAFLYPDAIPEELLVASASHVGPVLGPMVADVSQFDSALAVLRSFSLVQRQPETHTLSLHRLVQVILREEMSEQEQAEWWQRAIYLFNEIFPEFSPPGVSVETWVRCEQLLPHMLTCFSTIPNHRQDQELAPVLLKMADYLHKRSRNAQAEPLYQRALYLLEQKWGKEHPHVASLLYRLAYLYRSQGKSEQAGLLFQRAVRLLEQALGPEHLEIAFPLSGLAMVYREQGQYAQAEQLYHRALRIREQALGPEHPDVAGSLGSLGIFYHEQGQYAQAEQLYRRTLRIQEQALGSEHPDLARGLNNLGNLYIDQGKYKEAEPLCLHALHLFEEALGPDHPNVAVMLNTLAALYSEMGQYGQAQLLYQRSLSISEHAMGPDHSWVACSLNGLALLCREQGQYQQAEPLFRRALQIREQRLGRNHPETAQTLHDLAVLRQKQDNLKEAFSLAERALQIRSQSLGDIHQKTVASRTLVAQLVEARGTSQDGASCTCSAEEHPDHVSIAHLREEVVLTPQKASDCSPSENDPLQEFLTACCELHPRAWCRSTELWEAYQCWAERCQERYPLSRGAFITRLKGHGCRADRTKAARIWRGIALVKKNSDGG